MLLLLKTMLLTISIVKPRDNVQMWRKQKKANVASPSDSVPSDIDEWKLANFASNANELT